MAFSHVQLEWEIPEMRSWYERLAQSYRLVRYDGRGCGLSTRQVKDRSLHGLVRDLEAVAGEIGQQRFVLFAALHAGPVAVSYAVRHPDRVSHLILWCSYARHEDYAGSRQARALRVLRDQDWETYTETAARVGFGWSAGEEATRYAAFLRECSSQEEYTCAHQAIEGVDVTPLLGQVTTPVLVLHRAQVPYPDLDIARSLAGRMPGTRLQVLPGRNLAPFLGDTESVVHAINEFVMDAKRASYPNRLTQREVEVLRLIGAGKNNREIGETLHIARNTVERHVSHIFAKTRTASRAEAAVFGARHGLL